ncbi:sensor domain-containing protein [Mycolicibacterium llatzerense]|uniref:sensor domain-containing protein n=1 Tax=Mycolicibacterium llatzerense TaxID=280871 RepID=UPI0031D3E05C
MTATAKTIRTITHTTAARRGTVVRLATAAVLASMAVTAAGGTAAAAPSAPLPTFTGYGPTSSDNDGGGATTDSPLLSPKQVASTLGLGALTQISSSSKLSDHEVTPSSCISTAEPAESAAYSATPQAVAQNILKDAKDDNRITQAVVAMASKKDAIAQMKATLKQFKACAGTTITIHENESGQTTWTLGDPELNSDKTVLSIMQNSAKDGTCERALAATGNVVIDVMTCTAGSAHGQGVALATALADKASSLTA